MHGRIRIHSAIAVTAVILLSTRLSGQTSIALSPAPAPSSGQPGITAINLTGSGFPAGTIAASSVIVSLKPPAGGTATTTPASAVTTVTGTTRRVTFTIPSSIQVSAPTSYDVSLTGTTSADVTFASSNTASLTVNPPPQLLSLNPNTGKTGQALSITLTGSFTNFVQSSTVASFGAGISVGGAAEGAAGPVTVSGAAGAVAQIAINASAAQGPRSVTVSTGAQSATLASAFTVTASTTTLSPTVANFTPQSGTIGALVTINGSNFGSAPQVSMPGLNGSAISLPLQSLSAGALTVVIPTGAVTGPITVANSTGSAATASSFTVNASNTFTISASPSTATLIQGQSVAYTVQLASANGFSQLAPLSVSGLPAGVSASFKPSSITAGQTSILTLSAPATQPISAATLTLSAAATVDGVALTQATSTNLAIQAPTTSFIGRTVVSDSLETPLAGVTVTMLGVNPEQNGAPTHCTGTTVSDSAGNFALTDLPATCAGPQLVGFGGDHVTSPSGKYAGVNLVYRLTQGQVTVSPVLVHLPRIDNAETFQVQQNASTDQTYSFASVPGVTVTVYAHTTFTQQDGSQPNPFPLVAVQVPVDRLPEAMPPTNAGVMAFIVAFQPANVTASQPVAVSYPNTLNVPPGTTVPLMTLDPTRGRMRPYGTATVSVDGTQIVPDFESSASSHRFGIVNFDWHGWLAALLNLLNPCTCFGRGAGDPVDLSSGLQVLDTTDISISGTRGSISIQRTYRTLTTNNGTFGPGHELQYAWQLNTGTPNGASAINLIRPDGNQFLFSRQPNGTLTNFSIPWLQGAVMTTTANGNTSLRYKDGTTYIFQAFGSQVSVLNSVVDRNGNTTTFTQTAFGGTAIRITQIMDPVGRSINLTYDSSGHALTATDPVGRTVTYTYNATGTLATVTDPNGGVIKYQYDNLNRMSSMTDALGTVIFQDTYDATGRVSQQVLADGGVYRFTYALTNPLVPTSPVLLTAVTDPLGNQTEYRFNPQGFVTDVTDALGQTKSFSIDPGTSEVLTVTGSAQCNVCGPLGQGTISFAYDGAGNPVAITDALGNATRFLYEPVFNQVESITDALNHTTMLAYDNKGNITKVIDANGNTTSFTYDATGLPLTAMDAAGNMTTVAYDTFGNPTKLTDALGNSITIAFDAVSRPVQTTDALGKITGMGYDALDRILSVRDGRGSTTQATYDKVGNLLDLTDPRGGKTVFTYDSVGRIKTRTSQLAKIEIYDYDLAGNLVKFTDRRGQISQFQFDPLNRLAKEFYHDGSVVMRTYDPYSGLFSVNDSVGGRFGFIYDANGRLINQTEPNGTINYSRDALGRVLTRQVTGLSLVAYSYDAVGNMSGVSTTGAGATFSYDARNLLTSESRSNGVNTSFAFDPLGRVSSLIHAKGAATIDVQNYTYDPAGNRSSAASNISQPLITQAAVESVDSANELLTTANMSFTYDDNGNRLSENGQLGTTAYTWDARNRLTSVTDRAGNVTTLRYDFGRNLTEVERSFGLFNTSQKFIIDNVTNIASLTDSSGLPVSIVTGIGIDSTLASVDTNGSVNFGIGDSLGSTEVLTDGAGAVIAKLLYEPYGLTTGSTPAAYPFSFTGRLPVTSNIFYYRSRFYDASSARFLSEDEIGFSAGDYNLFRYVRNNPVSYVDPTGQSEKSFSARFSQAWARIDVIPNAPNYVKGPLGIFGWVSQGGRFGPKAVWFGRFYAGYYTILTAAAASYACATAGWNPDTTLDNPVYRAIFSLLGYDYGPVHERVVPNSRSWQDGPPPGWSLGLPPQL